VTGELCDPDRFFLELQVSLIPSFDFKYEGRRSGRPKEAVIGLNAQTVLDLEVRGATRGSYCNEDCQAEARSREKDAVQRQINDAGDLLELYTRRPPRARPAATAPASPTSASELSWPLDVTYEVEGTFDATVSGFTGAGVTWDRSRPRNERANPYVIPLQIDSRANLRVNAAVTRDDRAADRRARRADVRPDHLGAGHLGRHRSRRSPSSIDLGHATWLDRPGTSTTCSKGSCSCVRRTRSSAGSRPTGSCCVTRSPTGR
jgi:hypothetical protein